MKDARGWQERIDALSDDREWGGGWYQPIVFPDGSRTHSTKLPDKLFYSRESLGLNKWRFVIRPALVEMFGALPLLGKTFLEIGCNAGLYVVTAMSEGASEAWGVENHPQFYKQAQLLLEAEPWPGAALVKEEARRFVRRIMDPYDVVLLSNSLYWVCYSDRDGFIPDHEAAMAAFLHNLSCIARHVVIVGTESNQPAFGAHMADVLPRMEPHFEIVSAREHRCDRRLNVIAARSKVASRRSPEGREHSRGQQ